MSTKTTTTTTTTTTATFTDATGKARTLDVVALVAQFEGCTAGDLRTLVGAPRRVLGRRLRAAAKAGALDTAKVGRTTRFAVAK